jgi:glutathione peroxidase
MGVMVYLSVAHVRSPQGLEILAFPCNNFGGQEPDSNEAICEFASSKGATYPVFGKLECEPKDPNDTHPLYRFLKSSVSGGWMGDGLKWNFSKFLVNAEGKPIKRYLPITSPSAIEKDIAALLE